MNRKLRIVAVVIVVSMVLAWTGAAKAQSSIQSQQLLPSEDSYTDLNAPTDTYNNGGLFIASSDGPPSSPDVPTKFVFLKFDLSGLGASITQARLWIESSTCGDSLPADQLAMSLYGKAGADDLPAVGGWSEATLTYVNQPSPTTAVLAVLDSGTTTPNVASFYSFTDDTGGPGSFAAFLETERLGDGKATLILQVPDGYGNAEVALEDSERTFTNFSCPDVPSVGGVTGPILAIGTPGDPLAVTMSSTNAVGTTAGDKLPILPAIVLIVGTAVVLLGRRIRRLDAGL